MAHVSKELYHRVRPLANTDGVCVHGAAGGRWEGTVSVLAFLFRLRTSRMALWRSACSVWETPSDPQLSYLR